MANEEKYPSMDVIFLTLVGVRRAAFSWSVNRCETKPNPFFQSLKFEPLFQLGNKGLLRAYALKTGRAPWAKPNLNVCWMPWELRLRQLRRKNSSTGCPNPINRRNLPTTTGRFGRCFRFLQAGMRPASSNASNFLTQNEQRASRDQYLTSGLTRLLWTNDSWCSSAGTSAVSYFYNREEQKHSQSLLALWWTSIVNCNGYASSKPPSRPHPRREPRWRRWRPNMPSVPNTWNGCSALMEQHDRCEVSPHRPARHSP